MLNYIPVSAGELASYLNAHAMLSVASVRAMYSKGNVDFLISFHIMPSGWNLKVVCLHSRCVLGYFVWERNILMLFGHRA